MRQIDSAITHFLRDSGRTRLLAAITDPDHDRLWMREAGRHARIGMAGLYHEIITLEQMGMVRRYRAGGAAFIVVDTEHPVYLALAALFDACARLDTLPAQRELRPGCKRGSSGRWENVYDVVPPARLVQLWASDADTQ